jgi:hypothetical protein
MGNIKVNEFYIFRINNSFYVSIAIKIVRFKVSVTIVPSCSLLTVCYQELFDSVYICSEVSWLFCNLIFLSRHILFYYYMILF